MNDDNILGSALGQLGQTIKKVPKQVINLPEETSKEEKPANQIQKPDWKSNEERVKFLRDLYGKPDAPQDGSLKPKDKTPEEQKKLIELRNKLHKENYYDPTFNPVKKQEERPAEKAENEKKKEMIDLQKKEERKPPPLAVVREQNKTEIFRGTAG